MKTLNKLFLLLVVLSGVFVSCDDEPLPPVEIEREGEVEEEKQEAPALVQKVNRFILDGMDDIYLWYHELPDIDIKYEFDSKEYFDKLLYIEDKWSFITDDRKSLENSFEGIEKSYGWSLAFGRFSNTNTIFAIVEFVYPDTPAELAGIKRGDIIIGMSNGDITDNNYRDLLYGESMDITLGVASDGSISESGTVSLSAQELKLNPVLFTNIIEHDGHKIGYLFYAQYIGSFNTSLDSAFQRFKDEQVTDLVIDLRYNPGGGTLAAQHLCSSIAPVGDVSAGKTLVNLMWNDKYQSYLEENNISEELKILFKSDVPQKMDLNKVHILTGNGTASASELCITGLKPYMNVTTVGETTYGKYTASITLKPEYYYEQSSYYNEIDNWGIQPIVLRYANSRGVTDFKDGFLPDIEIEDDLFNTLPLGQKEEPLLKAAIEDITGTKILALKKATKKVDYKLFDRGFSRFDSNKRELHLDSFTPGFTIK